MTSPFSSDRAWQQWGEQDPYFAVLTDQALHRSRLTPEALAAFYQSGEVHVSGVVDTIRRHLDPDFRPGRALDFGCGVGRLLLPLAAVAESVVGVDVSPAMLAEARKHADTRKLPNVTLIQSDDTLSQAVGSFDLVHSFLVLQHIPVARGERIILRLVELLAPGGVAALHVPYARAASPLRRAAAWVRRSVPGVHGVLNRLRGAPWGQPPMQMNLYDLGRLHRLFEASGIAQVHTRFTQDGEYHGVMLYARKAGAPPLTS
jgi:2-polyprenyl-3-methyl-5-hydroxy-6-metoxy-1,4-benzoquinol methylase